MSKISTYPSAETPLLLSDRLIGTEAVRTPPTLTPLATKNFSLGELLQLFSSNFPAASLQAVLNTGNTATQNITLTGYIDVTLIKPDNIEDTSGSQGTTFQFLSKGASSINWVNLPVDNLQAVLNAGNTATQSITLIGNITSTRIIPGNIQDDTAGIGTTGQFLSKTASGIRWVNAPTSTTPGLADVLSVGNTATNNITLIGDITATRIIKSGGTSIQYLMADGSVTTGLGTIPTLQEVTDAGAVTTNKITVNVSNNLPAIIASNTTGLGLFASSDDFVVGRFNLDTASNNSNIVEFLKNNVLQSYITHNGTIVGNKSLINTTVDNGVDALQINGTASGSAATLSNQFVTKAQLDTKITANTSTNNYIPKVSGVNTFANSRLFDNGTYLGIGTVNAPTKDITLGNQSDKEIGIEQSDNTSLGKSLTVQGGRTINFVPNSDFNIVPQVVARGYFAIFGSSNGDVYGVSGGSLYKRTGGGGEFNLYSIGISDIRGLFITSADDMYICADSGLYKQTGLIGAFSLIVSGTVPSRIAVAPNGDIYGVTGTAFFGSDDVYKLSSGGSSFSPLGFALNSYSGIAVSNDGSVFVGGYYTGIYKQTLGIGIFTQISTLASTALIIDPFNNLYTGSWNSGRVSKLTNLTGIFNYVSSVIGEIYTLGSDVNGNIYAYSDALRLQVNYVVGSPNLAGGTLKLASGTGKGTGDSNLDMYTGQKTVSGTDMQIETLRARINNEGLMTLPSVTNALITADATGKAVVTKEYLSATNQNYWTANGNNIVKNNTGNVYFAGDGSGSVPHARYDSTLNAITGSFSNGDFNNNSIGIQQGTDGITMFINNIDTFRGWVQTGRNLTLNTAYSIGFIDFMINSVSKLKLNNNGTLKYATDVSSLYDARTLIDKGYADANYGGGSTKSINSVSTNTAAGSASSTDYFYFASGTINITLPTAVGNTNNYTIKNVGTGVITVNTTSSQTIDGSLTAPIIVQYLSLTIISDGANWNII